MTAQSLSEERGDSVFQRIRLSTVLRRRAARPAGGYCLCGRRRRRMVVVRSGEFSINSQPSVSESCIRHLNSVQSKDYFKSLHLWWAHRLLPFPPPLAHIDSPPPIGFLKSYLFLILCLHVYVHHVCVVLLEVRTELLIGSNCHEVWEPNPGSRQEQ